VKKPRGKGGQKEPASDDDEIWWQMAATIEPLKRGKHRVHPANEAAKQDTSAPRPKPKPEPGQSPTPKVSRAAPQSGAQFEAAERSQATTPALATFDRNSVRKIRAGRAEIEARVDLHGMRQHEAHAALRTFLARCHSRGLRFVLVITGKGKATGVSDSLDTRDERERGVLKRNVPRWLEEPDVRSIVVSYTTAAIQHGGEGALYVHLRTKDRS
jgi:DNA-nicking Smr family endonuclease